MCFIFRRLCFLLYEISEIALPTQKKDFYLPGGDIKPYMQCEVKALLFGFGITFILAELMQL